MKKKYPWGVDAEEKPKTNEDCGKIVHSMAKLKICMKGLAKRDSQLRSVATTMYATMKKKSQDFRGQRGNRYTKNFQSAHTCKACAKLEVASCDRTSAVNESSKLADRASRLRKTDERHLTQKRHLAKQGRSRLRKTDDTCARKTLRKGRCEKRARC